MLHYEQTGAYSHESLSVVEKKLAEVHARVKSCKVLTQEPDQLYSEMVSIVRDSYRAAECVLISLKKQLDDINPILIPLHSRLVEIKRSLESLCKRPLPSAFSLAEVQLLQDDLLEIDSVRIDGKFYSKGNVIVEGQGAGLTCLIKSLI